MSDFERIVRPFETGANTPPQTVPTAPYVRSKNVVINPGAGGATKTMSGNYSLTITFYLVNKSNEETQQ